MPRRARAPAQHPARADTENSSAKQRSRPRPHRRRRRQNDEGQITESHSISAGLDYPGVGPEHAYLQSINRAQYESVTDEEALNALWQLSKCEGIIPALESAHAVAFALKMAQNATKQTNLVVCLSGRGDKDLETVCELLKDKVMPVIHLGVVK